MSAHCHLTRKRPLLSRDSLGREQREIPGLVWEWSNRNREWGLLGRDSRERESREKFPVLFGLIEQYQELEKMEEKSPLTIDLAYTLYPIPYIFKILSIFIFFQVWLPT